MGWCWRWITAVSTELCLTSFSVPALPKQICQSASFMRVQSISTRWILILPDKQVRQVPKGGYSLDEEGDATLPHLVDNTSTQRGFADIGHLPAVRPLLPKRAIREFLRRAILRSTAPHRRGGSSLGRCTYSLGTLRYWPTVRQLRHHSRLGTSSWHFPLVFFANNCPTHSTWSPSNL